MDRREFFNNIRLKNPGKEESPQNEATHDIQTQESQHINDFEELLMGMGTDFNDTDLYTEMMRIGIDPSNMSREAMLREVYTRMTS